jgi:hypothetical protein
MILKRIPHPDGTVTFEGDGFRLRDLHAADAECYEHGCVVHDPSYTIQNDEGWPFNWREDRGFMERLCSHGVGHPDIDAANYLARRGLEFQNVHGCDGCCGLL